MVVVIDTVAPNLTTRQVSGCAVGATHLERTAESIEPLDLLVARTWQTLIRITSIRSASSETAER